MMHHHHHEEGRLALDWERGLFFPGRRPWKKKKGEHIPRLFPNSIWLLCRPNLFGILKLMKSCFMNESIMRSEGTDRAGFHGRALTDRNSQDTFDPIECSLSGGKSSNLCFSCSTNYFQCMCLCARIPSLCMRTTKQPVQPPLTGMWQRTHQLRWAAAGGPQGGALWLWSSISNTHSCEHLCRLTPCSRNMKATDHVFSRSWSTGGPLMASSWFTAVQQDQPTNVWSEEEICSSGQNVKETFKWFNMCGSDGFNNSQTFGLTGRGNDSLISDRKAWMKMAPGQEERGQWESVGGGRRTQVSRKLWWMFGCVTVSLLLRLSEVSAWSCQRILECLWVCFEVLVRTHTCHPATRPSKLGSAGITEHC